MARCILRARGSDVVSASCWCISARSRSADWLFVLNMDFSCSLRGSIERSAGNQSSLALIELKGKACRNASDRCVAKVSRLRLRPVLLDRGAGLAIDLVEADIIAPKICQILQDLRGIVGGQSDTLGDAMLEHQTSI